jgi:uncharacterized protein DUF6152
MKSRVLVVLTLAGGLLMVGTPVFGHHGLAGYDKDHPITVTGMVTDFEFVNPHIKIYFDVKDENGVVTNWLAVSAPPQKAYRAGWNRNSLKPGDTTTVTGITLKDGRKVISIQKLVAPNGQTLTLGAE